jgi:photosystem II stability/assembly factor-like uncharacterized protein
MDAMFRCRYPARAGAALAAVLACGAFGPLATSAVAQARPASAAASGSALPSASAMAAQPVGDALQRPALAVRQPERAVLLAVAQAGARLVAVGERGLILLSDDAGGRWRQAPVPVSVTLTAVRFADARHGVAVGHGGAVLVTEDGGAQWTLRLDGRRAAQQVLQDARAAGAPDATLRDAERLVADGPDKPFLDVLMWDAQRLLVVGAYGLVLHSADGGRHWTSWSHRLPNPRGLHWYLARRDGERLLLAGEQGLLAVSSDGGARFAAAASPWKGSWFTGQWLPGGGVLLAGLRGQVWRSTDPLDPAAWQAVTQDRPAALHASTVDAAGRVLLADPSGRLLRLQGQRLEPLATSATPPLPSGLLALDDGRVLVVGATGLARLDLSSSLTQESAR